MLSCAYKMARGAKKGLLIYLLGRDDGLETLEKPLDVCSSNSMHHEYEYNVEGMWAACEVLALTMKLYREDQWDIQLTIDIR